MRYGSLTVEIEFTAGVWTDVTSDVQLREPIEIKRGRNSILDVAQVGTCQLSLFNDSGKYTPGSPTSTYYPNVRPNVGLRVTVAGSQRFVGFIDKWSPFYPTSAQDYPLVQVTATDRFRLLSRRKLRHTYTETVAGLIPAGSLWDMNLLSPGLACGDVLGNRDAAQIVQPLSNLQDGTDGLVSYGTAYGPWRAPDGIQLDAAVITQIVGTGYSALADSGGSVVQLPSSCDFTQDSNTWTLGFWVQINAYYDHGAAGIPGEYNAVLASGAWGQVWINGNSTLAMELAIWDANNNVTTTALTFDPLLQWMFVVIRWDGTNIDVYLNGDLTGSNTVAYLTTTNSTTSLLGQYTKRRVYEHPNASITGLFFQQSDLTASDITEMYRASSSGFAGETAAERMQRLVTIAGLSPTECQIDTNGTQVTVGPLDAYQADLVTLGQDIAQAERGLFYVQTDGKLRFADRYARGMSTTPTVTFDQEAATSGTDFAAPIEDSLIANTVTITAGDGSSYTAIDADSVALNGTMTYAAALNVENYDLAKLHAEWHAATFGKPSPRIGSVTVDMFTAWQTSSSDLYESAVTYNSPAETYDGWQDPYALVFDCDLGSRIKITNLPATSQVATVLDGYVEGLSETYAIDAAAITFDTSPADLPAEFVLDDDVLSRLDFDAPVITGTVTTTGTSITITTSPNFTTTDTPFELDILGTGHTGTGPPRGERVTVTTAAAVSGGNQVLTVTRGTDGTPAVAHSSGERVGIAHNIALGF